MTRALISALLCVALLTLSSPSEAVRARKVGPPKDSPPLRGTVIHVIDGDTFVLRPTFDAEAEKSYGKPIRPLRIRLAGVDAPELCQRGGGEAREALTALIAGQPVLVNTEAMDKYARVVGRVSVNQEDVGSRLVSQGLAWSGSNERFRGPYRAMEDKARSQRRGVFADADALRPKVFRDSHGPCPHAPGSRLRRLRNLDG